MKNSCKLFSKLSVRKASVLALSSFLISGTATLAMEPSDQEHNKSVHASNPVETKNEPYSISLYAFTGPNVPQLSDDVVINYMRKYGMTPVLKPSDHEQNKSVKSLLNVDDLDYKLFSTSEFKVEKTSHRTKVDQDRELLTIERALLLCQHLLKNDLADGAFKCSLEPLNENKIFFRERIFRKRKVWDDQKVMTAKEVTLLLNDRLRKVQGGNKNVFKGDAFEFLPFFKSLDDKIFIGTSDDTEQYIFKHEENYFQITGRSVCFFKGMDPTAKWGDQVFSWDRIRLSCVKQEGRNFEYYFKIDNGHLAHSDSGQPLTISLQPLTPLEVYSYEEKNPYLFSIKDAEKAPKQ